MYLTHFMCGLHMFLLMCGLVDWLFDIIFRQFTECRYVMFGDRGGTEVKVLCYKSEGHWFDPSWCH